ncbi:MAG: hypothetical protein ACYSR5_04655 [Planctomycetota bacterium]|jgi:hypothetical protein
MHNQICRQISAKDSPASGTNDNSYAEKFNRIWKNVLPELALGKRRLRSDCCAVLLAWRAGFAYLPLRAENI